MAFGWDQFGDASVSTQVKCPTGHIDSVTGDPVVDCASDYERRQGVEPPVLMAYRTMQGAVHVLPAAAIVTDGYVRLPPGRYQDIAIIELRYGLDDFIDGFNSACLGLDEAEDLIVAEFDRLGFQGWSIDRDDSDDSSESDTVHQVLSADGMSATQVFPAGPACAQYALRPEAATVDIWLSSSRSFGASANASVAEFTMAGRSLHDALAAECMNLDRAVARAEELLGHLFVGSEEIHAVVDEGRPCASVDVVITGEANVRIVGPSS